MYVSKLTGECYVCFTSSHGPIDDFCLVNNLLLKFTTLIHKCIDVSGYYCISFQGNFKFQYVWEMFYGMYFILYKLL